MKPLEAAGEFWSVVDEVEAHRPIARRFDAACKVLKDYMVDKQLDTYQGIRLVESPGGKRLDLDSARAKFGDKLESCFIDSVRRSLIKVKRPARHAKVYGSPALVNAAQLANAAAVHFGGWTRAAHILTCDRCGHDDAGEFVACPRCPSRSSRWRPAPAAATKASTAPCTTRPTTANAEPTAE